MLWKQGIGWWPGQQEGCRSFALQLRAPSVCYSPSKVAWLHSQSALVVQDSIYRLPSLVSFQPDNKQPKVNITFTEVRKSPLHDLLDEISLFLVETPSIWGRLEVDHFILITLFVQVAFTPHTAWIKNAVNVFTARTGCRVAGFAKNVVRASRAYGALVKVESTYFCNPQFTPSLMIVGIHLGVERQCEVKFLVEGNNTTTEIRLKPPTSRSKVQHANHRTTALHNIRTCAISYFLNITLSLMPYMVTIARAILVDDSISLAAPTSWMQNNQVNLRAHCFGTIPE